MQTNNADAVKTTDIVDHTEIITQVHPSDISALLFKLKSSRGIKRLIIVCPALNIYIIAASNMETTIHYHFISKENQTIVEDLK